MKVRFHIAHPVRDPAGLMDLKQSAKQWVGQMIQALGDQLNAGGEGSITMEVGSKALRVEGVLIEFRVTHIPGILETKTWGWVGK